jgi:type IV pilus assembly protein PilV
MLVRKNTQRGVTLVEAMIALLVISVGLLGIASLQITAMSQNTSSLNHSQATWYAYNMSDRIRANFSAYLGYNNIDTAGAYSGDCMASACSTAQMITADAADWETMVESLPGGRGTVSLQNNLLVVTVMWDDDGNGATGIGCDPTDSTDLICYQVTVAQ